MYFVEFYCILDVFSYFKVVFTVLVPITYSNPNKE